MLAGLPQELWTNYRTFFWDNSTGLYIGAGLFGFGLVTFLISGCVYLRKRIRRGSSVDQKTPRSSIDNPLYHTSQQNLNDEIADSSDTFENADFTGSREVLVESDTGLNKNKRKPSDAEEKATVEYENEDVFREAKKSKIKADEDDVKINKAGKSKQRHAYSKVVKTNKQMKDDKSMLLGDQDVPVNIGGTADIHHDLEKSSTADKTSDKSDKNDREDQPAAQHQKSTMEYKTVKNTTDPKEDDDGQDYENVVAPVVQTLHGDDEMYLDMSYGNEEETDMDNELHDYENCRKLSKTSLK